MDRYNWPIRFHQIYQRAVEDYSRDSRKTAVLSDADELKFLATIGCKRQELFDFVEDFVHGGEPVFETVLLITAARRDYFSTIQNGQYTSHVIDMSTLPPKNAELAGIKWLPRIIAKARAKLRGEMPDELMYGCGGDRPFLKSVNVEPADFLRVVWASKDDDEQIVQYVLKCKSMRES